MLSRYPWRAATAIVILLYVVGVGVFTPRFETNDDTAMMFVVSGISYGEPRPHIPFSNILIGQTLRMLYEWLPSVPWYGLYLYIIQAFALLVITGSVFVILRPIGPIQALLGIPVLILGLQLVMNLQFTSVAIILGLAGILLHLAAGRRTLRGPWWAWHVLAGGMLGTASLVRWSSFLAAVLAAAPLVVATLRPTARALGSVGLVLGITLLIAFGASAVEGRVYDDRPEWREYIAYNSARGSLHGSPRLRPYEELRETYDAVGWSENDLRMFRTWFFADLERYSRDSLEQILHASRESVRRSGGAGDTIAALWAGWRTEILILAALASVMALRLSGRRRYLPMLYALHVVAILLYLLAFERLPDRVATPLLLTGLMGTIVIGHVSTDQIPWRSQGGRAAWIAAAIGLGLFGLAATTVPGLARLSAYNERLQDVVVERIQQLHELGNEAVFVSWGGALQLSHVHPLSHPTDELRDLNWVGLGWRVHSPDFDRHVASLGLTDIYVDIARRDNVYLAARPDYIGLFERYLSEHYGLEGYLEPVLDLRGVNATVYRRITLKN